MSNVGQKPAKMMAGALLMFLLVITGETMADILPPRPTPRPRVNQNKNTFFVSAPKEITRGVDFNVNVDILNGTNVEVTALLQHKEYNGTTRRYEQYTVQSATGAFSKGVTGKLKLPIHDSFKCDMCQLVIQGRGDQVFERSQPVDLKSKLLSIFIQTDKAIYKPGEKVRYRAFAVYSNLQVYNGDFDIVIKDPSYNRISVEKEKKSTSGVIEGFLNLSDMPPFGDWSIQVTVPDTSESEDQVFTVDQYELPRFEVTVSLEPFALLQDTQLSGTVNAKYTFGKPVKGLVELMIGPDQGPDHCGKMPKTVNTAFEIDGESKFSVPKSSIKRVMSIHHGTTVRVTAVVKETATGVKLNGSKSIEYNNVKYSMNFMTSTPNVFKPGLTYSAYLQIQSPDKKPPTDLRSNLITVYPYATYLTTVKDQDNYGIRSFTGTYPLPKFDVLLPSSGIAEIEMDIPKNATNINLRAVYKESNLVATKSIQKMYSKSNNFIQLTMRNSNLHSFSRAGFDIQGTEGLNDVTYEILSRGVIIHSSTVNGQGATRLSFDQVISPEMGPVANLVAYYARHDGEIIADSIAFNVDDIFKNKVSVDFNKAKAEPNTNVSLTVSADPGSQVFVLAVDQSVLLMKSGNDIDPSKVESGVSTQTQMDSEYALSHSSANVGDVFKNAGLIYITDAVMSASRAHGRNVMSSRRGGRQRFHGPQPEDDYGMAYEFGAVPSRSMMPTPISAKRQLKQVKRVRNRFLESWLWTDSVTNGNGMAVINTTVPDTITTWIASAFAINKLTGLGVTTTKANMTTFRSFFITLNYPRNLKKGEMAVIQATVFNYLPEADTVVVNMKNSPGFKHVVISRDSETPVETIQPQYVKVMPNEQGVVYFPIVADKIGVFDIEISAQTNVAADAVRRQIIIEPEGAPEVHNIPIFVESTNSSTYSERHMYKYPPHTVPGSQHMTVGVTGDLIGPSFDNIDNLISIPTGCGEQNMVKFAPNLYIMKYLKATNQLTDRMEEDIKDKLSAGYQRQLTYKRTDSAFSAFGNNDQSGSTWLTAFVARTFSEAKPFIYIDPKVMIDGVDWLVQRQRTDGSFVELGTVIDPNTQGKATGPALTAQCLLALLQNKNFISQQKCAQEKKNCNRTWRWANATQNAVSNLESQLHRITDPFTLSVVTNALLEAKSEKGAKSFRKLQAMAVTEGDLLHWAGNSTTSASASPYIRPVWLPNRVQARPIDILITSYALISYMAKGQTKAALPIVRWLAKQRNALGGFASTQDTTVALQALSVFATQSYNPNAKVSVRFSNDKTGEVVQLNINNENMMSLKRVEFQGINQMDIGEQYHIEMLTRGNGNAFAEMNFHYHTNKAEPSNAFDVSTVLLDDGLDNFNLMVCTKWFKEEKTGMVVQEIEIPSGFEADLSSIGNVAGMKRYERKGNVAAIYFDEIVKTSTCYSLLMSRKSKVARSVQSYVRTTRYYSPADKSTVFYHPRKLSTSTICDVCPKCSRSC